MKRLVLLGGGHAHVHVLQALAREPLAGAEVTLVTPFMRHGDRVRIEMLDESGHSVFGAIDQRVRRP